MAVRRPGNRVSPSLREVDGGRALRGLIVLLACAAVWLALAWIFYLFV